jgi:hypothetical protein
MDAFDDLQAGLGRALAANRPGEAIEHALVVLPSYSVSESLLSHYGDRIPVDHRSRTGVVLHMLSGLAIDGRLGLTAIGMTPDEATHLHSRTEAAISSLSAQGSQRGPG